MSGVLVPTNQENAPLQSSQKVANATFNPCLTTNLTGCPVAVVVNHGTEPACAASSIQASACFEMHSGDGIDAPSG